MSEGLAHQQSQLLQALFGSSHHVRDEINKPMASRGLRAYQANGQALAERALTAAYPVVAQMLGQESFASLARYFWQQHPPQRGDMAQWGSELADFLEATPQLKEEPFLGDVARVEWALHGAASAADPQPDLASFALLGQPGDVTLRFGPGVFLLAGRYPVVSLINAHLLDNPSLVQAADKLQNGDRENALVWRQGFKPCLRQSSAAEHALLQALQSGQMLEQALDAAFEKDTSREFDFNQWLTQSVQSGLITGATTVRTPYF
jgi:hypothetical protein